MTYRMLDSITPPNLPPDAPAYAGYVGGAWPTFGTLQRMFPHARLLSIAVNAGEDAECLDVENGDATPDQAPAWVHRTLARGVWCPVVYCPAAVAGTVLALLERSGLPRTEFRLWSAHWTYQPHICGRDGYPQADATQWSDKAPGLRGSLIDESLTSDNFWPAPKPPPPAPKPVPREDTMITGQITGTKQDIVLPNGVTTLRFGNSMSASIAIDLRDGKAEVPLTLTDKATQSVTVPDGVDMVVVHVTTAASDGTPVSYAGW